MSYLEGIDYVVCPECGSHVLLGDVGVFFDDGDERRDGAVTITCDWDACAMDFFATIQNPRRDTVEKTQ